LIGVKSAKSFIRVLHRETVWLVSHAVEKQKPGYGTGNKSTAVYVFCSFLSFSETGVGEARLKEANVRWEWAEVTRGLDNLQQGNRPPR
jgi:hypothetical protein